MTEGVGLALKKDVPIHMVSNCADTDMLSPNLDGTGIRDGKGWAEKPPACGGEI